jgi:hypothetical protein
MFILQKPRWLWRSRRFPRGADEADHLVCSRLYRAAFERNAENAGKCLAHLKPVRTDLRSFGNQGNVCIHDHAASLAHDAGRMGEEDLRGGAAPLWIRRREMIADVAGAAGRQQGIGECMQPHICVRMALEALIMRDFHAAQRHEIARNQPVHIIAIAGAHIWQGGAFARFCDHVSLLRGMGRWHMPVSA